MPLTKEAWAKVLHSNLSLALEAALYHLQDQEVHLLSQINSSDGSKIFMILKSQHRKKQNLLQTHSGLRGLFLMAYLSKILWSPSNNLNPLINSRPLSLPSSFSHHYLNLRQPNILSRRLPLRFPRLPSLSLSSISKQPRPQWLHNQSKQSVLSPLLSWDPFLRSKLWSLSHFLLSLMWKRVSRNTSHQSSLSKWLKRDSLREGVMLSAKHKRQELGRMRW